VPTVISNWYTIRIEDASDPTIFDESVKEVTIISDEKYWQELDFSPPRYVSQIIQSKNSTLFMNIRSSILFSEDYGKSWQTVTSDLTDIGSITTDSLNQLYLASSKGIYRTTDYGHNWEALLDSIDYTWFTDFLIFEQYLYALADNFVYISEDYGGNWFKSYPSDSLHQIYLHKISRSPNGSLFLADSYKGVYRSTDNGTSWLVTNSGIGYNNGRSIAVNSDGVVFFGADHDTTIYKSFDNGDTWKSGNHIFTGDYSDMDIQFDSNNNVVINSYYYVSVSKDLGECWESLHSGSDAICITDKNTIILANKFKLYQSDYLVTAIESDEPKYPQEYILSQNYPNPFNPTTIINYELPNASNVKLIVYDVLGREVETLVNKTQHPGKHSVTFDASGLASGVYYYKIKTGTNYEQTRKMLLIR